MGKDKTQAARDRRDDRPGRKTGGGKDDPAARAREGGRVPPKESGGRDGPDPTRYGDWEIKGRCIDF